MSTKRLDGVLFSKMLINGLSCLRANEEELNSMNVFPVADGDTGTNMCLTLENGVKSAKPTKELYTFLHFLSEGMLYGARGNSGVILSQLFSGFCSELGRYSSVSAVELKNAFTRAYKCAYSSVVCPVEGTILTVSREGIENIRHQVRRDTTIEQFLSMYTAEMRKSLSYTPQLLPDLKEAGVVDSGAMGYILIIEGMLKYLYGETFDVKPLNTQSASAEPDYSLFDENSPFLEGYCMEFILQRMNDNAYDSSFRLPAYIKELESLGSSLVAVENGFRVKIHIHTKAPGRIIELSQRYGEFLSFKLENMQLQHNEKLSSSLKKHKHSPIAVIAVADGEGMKNIYSENGCLNIIEGGASMNCSAQDFAELFREANADKIIVLPNHKNIIPAAIQAGKLSKLDNVIVIPTENMVEGYFTLAMDVPDSDDTDFRIRQMQNAAEGLQSISVTRAVRDSHFHGIHCHAGDYIAFVGSDLVAVDSQPDKLIFAAIDSIEIEDKCACVLFRGEGVNEDEELALTEAIADRYPWLEFSFLYGGQSIYPWLIGII